MDTSDDKRNTHLSSELTSIKSTILSELKDKIKTYTDILSEDEVKKSIVAICQFEKHLLDTALEQASDLLLPFGKHQGKKIMDMWEDDSGRGSGRSYLEWLVTQSWLFEDIRNAIIALKKSSPPSKFAKQRKKKSKVKQEPTTNTMNTN